MLEGAILPTLWKLSAPTIAVMVLQGLVNTAEVYFLGRLGSQALAGAALCFPMMMLMSAMSGAGMGGGVSSAIARALGGQRLEQARALIFHALLLGAGFGLFFTVLMEFAGEPLYRALGGAGSTLAAAVQYSTIFFRGGIAIWVFNTLASIYRGAGQPAYPAQVGAIGGVLTVFLSPALIFGAGPIPALGISGAAIAVVLYTTAGSLVLAARLLSHRSPLRPSLDGFRYDPHLFNEILRVGLPSSINTVVSTMGFMIMTGLVGRFGSDALAAFGVGTRFEFVLIPVVFGFGTAVVTMVGAAIGAHQLSRAKEVTRIAVFIAAGFWGSCGVLLTIAPRLWLGIFTSDPRVLEIGVHYFRRVGPFYSLVGAGMIIYFACQGIGRATLPMLFGFGRFGVALALGWAVVHFGGGVDQVFAAVAVGLVLYGLALIATILITFRQLTAEPPVVYATSPAATAKAK